MAQDKKPNVDDLFARMFGGTKPQDNESGEEDVEETPQAKEAVAKPPAKAQKSKPDKSDVTGDAPERPETSEQKPKARREKKTAAEEEIKYFGGARVNSRGRVHVSYWLETRLVAAIDRRCARERLLGKTGEKSSVVESALAEYLSKELDEIDAELL